MGRIIGGIVLIVAGSLILFYLNQLYKLFGDIPRAERNFADSRIVYILFGCFIIVVGVLIMFGVGTTSPLEISDEITSSASAQ